MAEPAFFMPSKRLVRLALLEFLLGVSFATLTFLSLDLGEERLDLAGLTCPVGVATVEAGGWTLKAPGLTGCEAAELLSFCIRPWLLLLLPGNNADDTSTCGSGGDVTESSGTIFDHSGLLSGGKFLPPLSTPSLGIEPRRYEPF
jgi:hypothetical protein